MRQSLARSFVSRIVGQTRRPASPNHSGYHHPPLLLLFCLLLGTASGTRAELAFAPADPPGAYPYPVYPTGQYPTSLALGDVRANGTLDAVTANVGMQNVSALLGTGDFSSSTSAFGPTVNSSIGLYPVSVALAALDPDPYLDLVVADFDGKRVWVARGQADGSFGAATSFPVGLPSTTPFSVAVADVNGDSLLDIVTANTGGSVSVLPGIGDGTFGPPTRYPVANGFGANTLAVAIGQLDGLNGPDLVTANANIGTLSVLLGTPAFTFPTHQEYPVGSTASSQPVAVKLADLNNDNTLDLISVNHNDKSVSLLLANGDGTFQPQRICDAGPILPTSITVADLDGNGFRDLITGNTGIPGDFADNVVSVFLGTGDFSGPGCSSAFPTRRDFPVGGKALDIDFLPVATADFNHDGKPDLAAAFTDNDGANNYVALLLNGFEVGVSLSAIPAFPSRPVGTTSTPQPVTLTNGGTTSVGIGSITTTGDFAIASNNCGATTLAVGASCSLTITFTPTASGARTGELVVEGSAGFRLTSASLSGTGGAVPPIDPNPSLGTVDPFPGQTVGTTSAAQPVTLSNTGGAPYEITNIGTSGDFAVSSHDCGTSLAANASCTLQVTFTPTGVGTRNGMLTVTGTTGSPLERPLSGTGIAIPPIDPNPALDTVDPFPGQTVGTTSAAQAVTLSNTGGTAYEITNIGTSGDFAVSGHDCGTSLAANASCTLQVTFTPTGVGIRNGMLTVTGTGSPLQQALSGTGVDPSIPNPTLGAVSPFPGQTVGTTSAAQAVTLSNTGGAPYNIVSITAGGDFAVGHDCGSSLAPGASCTLQVSFTPSEAGTRVADLTVTGTTGSPLVASLSGIGNAVLPTVNADLKLRITGPRAGAVGQTLRYLFVVRNRSSKRPKFKHRAPSVVVTANLLGLPADQVHYRSMPSFCSVSGQTLTCNLGFLSGKRHKWYRFGITVQPTVQAELIYSGKVSGFFIDPRPANNSRIFRTRVR